MKRISRVVFLSAVLSPLLSVSFDAPALAQRAMGPSARAAARLKNHPPANWIRHYLGDDRYKIAGGVWKVVSTETDRYYYPAWAPEMLRQKPGIVIGFSSAAEAEEAGYLPSSYPMDRFLYGLTTSEILAAKKRLPTVQNTGQRITLSDGRSTVALPKGWKHVRVTQGSSASARTVDLLTPAGSNDGIAFTLFTVPGGINVEPLLTPDRVRQLQTQLDQSTVGKPDAAKVLDDAEIQTGALGERRGVVITPSKNTQLPTGMTGRLTVIGRGSKLYIMSTKLPTSDAHYRAVVKSFQPR